MPVADFDGNTFVAFTDISGFKDMMKVGKRAVRALDILNRTGYNQLQANPQVNGFFISDCGILFVRDANATAEGKLESLLRVVEGINRSLLDEDIMLTTSIAYGRFSYHQRLEFVGIEKNPLFGNAYVAAFLDNEAGKPIIQPGQCRIVAKSIKDLNLFEDTNSNQGNEYQERLVKKRGHYYFYWMVRSPNDIINFDKEYNDAYRLKYQGMLKALQGNG